MSVESVPKSFTRNIYVIIWTVFFFNDTATTEIYTLSLHDALPICARTDTFAAALAEREAELGRLREKAADASAQLAEDRKSTRLNSSHANISYAVFCLKKKNNTSI